MLNENEEHKQSSRIIFLGNEITYTLDTLTPRLETESLVLGILPILNTVDVVIDVGTGSGCILVSLVSRAPHLKYYGTDISKAALNIAKYNIRQFDGDITLMHTHLAGPCLQRLPQGLRVLVVANLPYIPPGVSIPIDVISEDPALALWGGGTDGLEIVRLLLAELIEYKNQLHITVALELFESQVDILYREQLSMIDNCCSWADPCGIERFCSFNFSYETN